jgi:hypothetical protein
MAAGKELRFLVGVFGDWDDDRSEESRAVTVTWTNEKAVDQMSDAASVRSR